MFSQGIDRIRADRKRRNGRSGARFGFLFEDLESRFVLASSSAAIELSIRELLVEYDPQANVQVRAANRFNGDFGLVRELTAANRSAMGFGVMEVVRISPGSNLEQAIRWFSDQPGVKYAEPNQKIAAAAVSNDPEYASGNLWATYGSDTPDPVGPAGTTNPFGTAAENVWNTGNTGSSTVYVGIVDEGVDITHPDLAANIWVNPYDPIDGVDNDGNGYVDDTHGWDFAANDNTVYDGPSDDHGTHVAGSIAARGGNGLGVAGATWNTTLIVTKFLSASGGSLDGAIRALDYLTDLKTRHGIDIVAANNSWVSGASTALNEAILRAAAADVLFVAAAGNSGSDNDFRASYPSSYSTLNATASMPSATYESVVSVAAIDANGNLPSYSSYGATSVDLAAPGSNIRSTLPGGTYGTMTGTSMATAQVTGTLALLKAAHPNASAWKLRAAMLDSAVPTASLAGKVATGGRLNVFDASSSQVWNLPQALPTAVIDDVSTVEGQSGPKMVRLTVRLSNPFDEPVAFAWATHDATAQPGIDYDLGSGTLEIPAGQTLGTIDVTVTGDRQIEADEFFFVELSAASNARVEKARATVRIVNDDAPPPVVTISDASAKEGNRFGGVLDFVISLNGPVNEDLAIDYATANGTATGGIDYVVTSGRLTVAAGATSARIQVPIVGDRVVEPDETVLLNLSLPDPWFDLTNDQAIGTILDDDTKGGKGRVSMTGEPFDNESVIIAVPADADFLTASRTDEGAFGGKNRRLPRGYGLASAWALQRKPIVLA